MILDGSAHAQTGVMRTIEKQEMACVTWNETKMLSLQHVSSVSGKI